MEFKLCIILTLLPVGKVIGDCPSTVHKDVQGFGTGCKYRCNCKNQLCNNMTGECQDGCLPGWMGPSCQYRNLANQILRSQQYPTAQIESEKASVATDGNVTTCSRTGSAVGQQTFWYAELREQTYIVGFVIKTNQEDTDRFQGFSINVGNNTNVTEICYRHGVNANGNTTMDINCEKPVVGSIFRIQLAESENRPLVLCEVEIYGGRLVSFNKPTSIESTRVYVGTWNSFYVVDGRHPKLGEDQDNKTIRTCAATETSIPARNKWWKVDLNNTYSIIAVSFYGRYSNPEQFERFIVKTGFNDSSLQLFFEDNPPSSNVNEYVPKSKNLIWPVDGAVAKVERSGMILVVCELEVFADCKYGFCGWECNETCMCSSQTTGKHKILGTCPHGCSSRWTGLGSRCDIECPVYKWGLSCNNTCGNCVESCYAATGNCPGSCKPGWKLPKCSEECDEGEYGDSCAQKCENCLNGKMCDHVTGECPSGGCAARYQGSLCNIECSEGYFGTNCTSRCGNCKDMSQCNKMSGNCTSGCQPGYKQPFCNDIMYNSAEKSNGNAATIGGSVGGALALTIIVIVAVVVLFKRSRRNEQNIEGNNGNNTVVYSNTENRLQNSDTETSTAERISTAYEMIARRDESAEYSALSCDTHQSAAFLDIGLTSSEQVATEKIQTIYEKPMLEEDMREYSALEYDTSQTSDEYSYGHKDKIQHQVLKSKSLTFGKGTEKK